MMFMQMCLHGKLVVSTCVVDLWLSIFVYFTAVCTLGEGVAHQVFHVATHICKAWVHDNG